ncbi:DNRLRE domain-containing protein [Solwaraspora sp. WMMB762]|uniref:DNRLRE domain-containing protein n=1 Tax=Solwaraspora sp. WMMB762 TaxID=3404120 RepID=UPI003B92BCBE
MTAPRLLSPFTRTRTRLTLTVGLLVVALVAATLPWLRSTIDRLVAPDPAPSAGPLDDSAALAQARRTGKEVLIDTATTATSLTWARPDGQLRTTSHAIAQRARDATGQWAELDTTLTRTGAADQGRADGAGRSRVTDDADGLGVRPVNAPAPVRFSSGGPAADRYAAADNQPADTTDTTDRVLAELDLDGHTITYTWPGPLPEPVLDGPRALYPDVLPGVDLLMVVRDDGGVGQLLIVKTPDAATVDSVRQINYGLRSSTAVFQHDPVTGGVRILDPADDQEISSIPTPFGWDSSGRNTDDPDAPPRTSVATTTDVLRLSGLSGAEPGSKIGQLPSTLDGDGTGEARLRLDAAASGLLDDAEVRFPIFLDPTMRSTTQAWATIYSQHPNTNTWNGTNFNNGTTVARVGYEEETPLRARTFWRMGFNSNIEGATVSSASLRLLNNHSWSCQAREMRLWLTGAISSGTTWKKQPDWISEQQRRSFAHGYSNQCADAYVSFDVQQGAQAGATNGWSQITFVMRATDEDDTHTWRKFQVSATELTVVYNRSPNEPTAGTVTPGGNCAPGPGGGTLVARTNLVLAATGSDPDGNLRGLRFRFWPTGGTVPAGTLVTSLSSGRGSVTIPATSLVDGVTYSWDVRSEDTDGATSWYFPPGDQPCRITIDASAPPAPAVTSDVFLAATPDGATWATVKFGQTGPVTFTAADAAQFSYALGGRELTYVTANSGTATVPDLRPRHSGPTTLQVYAYDAAGNRSARTDHTFYVPPRDTADGPGDTGGDGRPDLTIIDADGNLRTYPSDTDGALYGSLAASYSADGQLDPAGHWYDPATSQVALLTKYGDAFPGDGITDLFVRTPDGGFWIYPGDGYGSFDVDDRIRVRLPAGAPDPATWTQLKAVGDITGDGHPDLALRAGTAFWTLSGYTGASFQQATLMEGTAWARREIVNVVDIDQDGTPDLLWRDLDNGRMSVRHGLPGTVAGSVDLHSLKLAVNSRDGDVSFGTGWSAASVDLVIGVPDVNGDGVPDMWARWTSDGQLRVYHPSTSAAGTAVQVLSDTAYPGVKGLG